MMYYKRDHDPVLCDIIERDICLEYGPIKSIHMTAPIIKYDEESEPVASKVVKYISLEEMLRCLKVWYNSSEEQVIYIYEMYWDGSMYVFRGNIL